MPIRSTINTAKNLFLPFFRQSKALYSTSAHPISQLEVLDTMVQLALKQELPNLEKTAFIGAQHGLETTATLFQSLIQLGIQPCNMFFSGKCYSTAPTVARTIQNMGVNFLPGTEPELAGGYQAVCREDVRTLWKQFKEASHKREIDRVIILDDGGRCIEDMPYYLPFNYFSASIEQTRGGLYSSSLDKLILPLIEVASSAVKKHIESPMIAQAVLNRVKKLVPSLNLNNETVCGVVGNGAIGNAIAKYLLSLGQNVVVFDDNTDAFKDVANEQLVRVPNIEILISCSSHVFGCTGRDITKDVDIFNIVEKDITLISCTSEDKEFLSLLQKVADEGKRIYFEPLGDIICLSNKRNKILILKGGFPVNFDREPWNVPAKDIEVTQGLLLGASIQAILTARKPIKDGFTLNQPKRHMLDPYLQQRVLREWLKYQPNQRYSQELLSNFDNIEWIIANSGGTYYPNPKLSNCFLVEEEKNESYRPKPN
jgi:S-adenosylhomocysteine hydrolase